MFFIAAVLLTIFCFMIYVYIGLRLCEDIKNQYALICFYLTYTLFGFIIINIVMLNIFWEQLSNKKGPPGPRGPNGDTGDIGLDGKCENGEAIYFIKKEVKESIVILLKGRFSEFYDDSDKIYNEKEVKLVNNYLDNKVDDMIESKEFKILLNYDSNSEFGKTLNQIKNKIINYWSQFLNIIYKNQRNNPLFFKTPNKLLDQNSLDELEKYDIWNWGDRETFRQLIVDKCGGDVIDSTVLNALEDLSNKYNKKADAIKWYGYPLKKNAKYSIYTYLGKMPISVVINSSTGRKFILIQDGLELNKYKIFQPSSYKVGDSYKVLSVASTRDKLTGFQKGVSNNIELCIFKEDVNNINQFWSLEYDNDLSRIRIITFKSSKRRNKKYLRISLADTRSMDLRPLQSIVDEYVNNYENMYNSFNNSNNSNNSTNSNNSNNSTNSNNSNNSTNSNNSNNSNDSTNSNNSNNSNNDEIIVKTQNEIKKYLSLILYLELNKIVPITRVRGSNSKIYIPDSLNLIKITELKSLINTNIYEYKDELQSINRDLDIKKMDSKYKLDNLLDEETLNLLTTNVEKFQNDVQGIKESLLSISLSSVRSMNEEILFVNQPFHGVDANIFKENISGKINYNTTLNEQKNQQEKLEGQIDFDQIFDKSHKIPKIDEDKKYKGDEDKKKIGRKNLLLLKQM